MNFGLILTLAWRNLWRHPRRTSLMLVAVAIGVWSMVALAALSRGIMDQQVQRTIRQLTGHIQIHTPAYRDDPVIENSMSPPDKTLKRVLQLPEVRAWATRVRVPAVIASERESAGVTLVGIDPRSEGGLSFIADAVTEGRALASAVDPGVVIGRELAERLETRVGKRVVLMSQDQRNDIADRGFRIVGIFDAETKAVETAYVFVGRAVSQQLLGMGQRVSELALVTAQRDDLGPLLARLRSAAPERDVRTWMELEPLLVLTMDTFEVIMYIWYVVVFLAMSFGLVNTLLMAVFERTRELGLFQALGMRPGWILGQVMVESLALLVMGLALGNVAAWLTVLSLGEGIDVSRFADAMEMFQMGNILAPALHARDVVAANLVVFVLGALASFYPAWRAARYVPIEAITRG